MRLAYWVRFPEADTASAAVIPPFDDRIRSASYQVALAATAVTRDMAAARSFPADGIAGNASRTRASLSAAPTAGAAIRVPFASESTAADPSTENPLPLAVYGPPVGALPRPANTVREKSSCRITDGAAPADASAASVSSTAVASTSSRRRPADSPEPVNTSRVYDSRRRAERPGRGPPPVGGPRPGIVPVRPRRTSAVDRCRDGRNARPTGFRRGVTTRCRMVAMRRKPREWALNERPG